MSRSGRLKDENALPVPGWFGTNKYAPLEKFDTAQLWLEQFAIRIDLLALIKGLLHGRPQ
jgi:hypothetical protein